GGGSNSVLQFMTRPFPRLDPYTTSARELYLCSSSTPPGGGVHGMFGYHAARSALVRAFAQLTRAYVPSVDCPRTLGGLQDKGTRPENLIHVGGRARGSVR